MYHSQTFWVAQGKTYFNEYVPAKYVTQEEKLLEVLDTLQFKSVLEVGVGFGRIAKLIMDNYDFAVRSYLGIDISSDQIAQAKRILKKEIASHKAKLEIWDFFTMQDSAKYDLVICAEVLMHIEPEFVQFFLDKLIGLSSAHVVTIDYYPEIAPRYLADFNFIHDYPKLYGKPVNQTRAKEQVIFQMSK